MLVATLPTIQCLALREPRPADRIREGVLPARVRDPAGGEEGSGGGTRAGAAGAEARGRLGFRESMKRIGEARAGSGQARLVLVPVYGM